MRSATVAESYSSSSSASIQQAIDRLDSVIGKLLQIQPSPEPSLKQLQDEIKKLQEEINKKTPISNSLKSDELPNNPSVAAEAMEPERAWTESTGQRSAADLNFRGTEASFYRVFPTCLDA
jgi:cell division septum initiation protein DivIVA